MPEPIKMLRKQSKLIGQRLAELNALKDALTAQRQEVINQIAAVQKDAGDYDAAIAAVTKKSS
jgi:hypothetical protein